MICAGDVVEIRTNKDMFGLVKVKEINPRLMVVEYKRSKDWPVCYTDEDGKVVMENKIDIVQWSDIRAIRKLTD